MMKCPNCSKEIAEDSKFCEYCGTPLVKQDAINPQKPALNLDNKIIGGVCSGFAKHNDKSTKYAWLLRISYVISTLCYGMGIVLYIINYFTLKKNTRVD